MSEGERFSPDPEERKSPEFDQALYPEHVGGKALPSLDNKTTMMEIDDIWGDKNSIGGIPVEAIRPLNMPRLGPSAPDEARRVFEQGIGLAIVACRKEELEGEDPEALDSAIKIYVPTIDGEAELLVRRRALPRKISPD